MSTRCEASAFERDTRTSAIMACEKSRDERTIQQPNKTHRFLTLVLVASNAVVSAALTERFEASSTTSYA
jgi:hypothetical protein